jgi:hypothetical protein
VGDDALREIESRYPHDRVAKAPVWRALIFLFSCVILGSLFGLAVALNRPSRDGMTVLMVFFGIALAVATEFQQGPLRFDGTGGEAATSCLSLAFLIGAAASVLESPASPSWPGWILLLAAMLFAGGWWRWGFPLYAVFSAASLFFGISALVPLPRLAWIAAAGLLAASCGRFRERSGLAPAQRAGMSGALAVALAAAYAAVNLNSFDRGAIEELRPGPAAGRLAWPFVRGLSIAATVIFPIAAVAAGAKRRSRLLIDLGIGFGALSLVTLRAYVRLGPLWLVVTEAGVGLVLLAFSAERFLERGPGRERRGLTAEPLFEDAGRAQVLSAAAAAATFAPEARSAGPEKGLSAGGGGFGGGGAGGEL